MKARGVPEVAGVVDLLGTYDFPIAIASLGVYGTLLDVGYSLGLLGLVQSLRNAAVEGRKVWRGWRGVYGDSGGTSEAVQTGGGTGRDGETKL